MKKQCFDSLPKNKDIKNTAYDLHISQALSIFKVIQDINHQPNQWKTFEEYKSKSTQLFNAIKKVKSIKPFRKDHATQLYDYFLKLELSSLYSIRDLTDINVKIVKSIKSRINFQIQNKKQGNTNIKSVSIGKIDWKQLWQRICKECPQTRYNSNSIQRFIQSIKKHFDENNVTDVWEYFSQSNNQGMQRKMVRIFTNITKNTNKYAFQKYLLNLIQYFELKKINRTQLIVLFVAATKLKKIQIDDQADAIFCNKIYQKLNNCMNQAFTLLTTDKKKGYQRIKISSSSAFLLQPLLGKLNEQGSIKLLDNIFYLINKIVKPLQTSTECVSFLYQFFKNLERRLQKQNKTRQSLKKLIQKKQKKEDQDEEQQQEEDDEKNNQEDEEPETDILGQLTAEGFVFEEEQQEEEADLKLGTQDQKIKKFQLQLKHQITPQILNKIKQYLDNGLFAVLYYVNSKKTVPHLLKYIYRIFPTLSITALDLLDKAGQISNINQEALIKNMTIGVQGMFTDTSLYVDKDGSNTQHVYRQATKNVMRILEKAYNTRRIVDVWPIYENITARIPLLDEKDLLSVSDEQKQLFLENFGMNHDRFYEQYSEHVMQAFKRLLREGQYLEAKDEKKYNHSLAQLYFNTYPFMKKRLIQQVMEVISEKPNILTFNYFIEAQLPKKQEEILKNQLSLLSENSEQTKQLRENYVSVLVKNYSLSEFKPWIKKFAAENCYGPLKKFLIFKISQSISWQPLPSSLSYMYSKYKFNLMFDNPEKQIKKNLKQLQEYQNQLTNQLISLVYQLQKQKDINDTGLFQNIIGTYNNSDKIKVHKIRKSIVQILEILNIINSTIEDELLIITGDKNKKFTLKPSQIKYFKLINTQQNSESETTILYKLLTHKQVLNDPNILKILSAIIENQFFFYEDLTNDENKRAHRNALYNKNHQVPGFFNRVRYIQEYLAKTRMFMAAKIQGENLNVRHKLGKDKYELIFKLLASNGNDRIQDLMKIFKQTGQIDLLKQLMLKLVELKTQNRLLIKKVSQILRFLAKEGIKFSNDSIQLILDYHVKFLQSHDSKIRQNANKSIKKVIRIISNQTITRELNTIMKKYLKIQKMEMIWLIYAITVLGNQQFKSSSDNYEQVLTELLPDLQLLLLDQSRSIRRISLYIYSVFIRKIKRMKTQYQKLQFEDALKEKDIQEFIQKGFLRPQFYQKTLKDRKKHIRTPLKQYQIKNINKFEYNYFDFIISSSQNAIKFVSCFHSDMVASTQMLASAIQSSMLSVDLFSAATKSLQKIFFYMKTKDMSSSRVQIAIGARFFKYLFREDAEKGYKFFDCTKEVVLNSLSNLQSLDNQTLVLIYASSLLNAYQATYTEKIQEIQIFLKRIFKQIIQKSSGSIFKKFLKIFFQKPMKQAPLKFLIQMLQNMISKRKKVCRSAEMLLRIHQFSLKKQIQIFKILLSQRIDLQSNYFQGQLYELLLYPQSSPYKIRNIEQTKVINLEKAFQQGKLIKFNEGYVIVSMNETQKFILEQIKKMIQKDSPQEIKAASNFFNKLLKVFPEMIMFEQNIQFMTEVLKQGIGIYNSKKQLHIDNYDQFIKSLTKILSSQKFPKNLYEKIALSIIQNTQIHKKGLDILKCLVISPTNTFGLNQKVCTALTTKILKFQSNSSLFKEILFLLSSHMTYTRTTKIQLQQLIKSQKNQSKQETKRIQLILKQAYLLANNHQLDPKLVKDVLKGGVGQKDKRNIWARQMMMRRGRREYFDSEQTYDIWKQIKQISNPYHYIA